MAKKRPPAARAAHAPAAGPRAASSSGPAAAPALPALAVPVLAAVAAALLHWRALAAPFFADDWLFLDQARARSLVAALLSPDPIGNFFRPLGRVLWFGVLGRASGESPVVFHAANLALWVLAVVLLWALARRLGGERVAAVAAGVFALTYAADVPVLWASGAQDLLALVLALGALLAVSHGRIAAGAALLFVAPLAKETAAVALVPAVLLAWRPGEGAGAAARRCGPLVLATLAWAALAALVVLRRSAPAAGLALSPWGVPAALADLARVALGLEWRTGGAPWSPPAIPTGAALVAIALAGVAVALVARRARAGDAAPARGAWLVAAAWALAGALPVALVAPVWSGYYLLFAMAGVALLAGLAVARAPAGLATAVVLFAGLAAQQPRALDEFATAPSAWSAQSHVSRFYLERGMAVASRCVADLRAARPTVPSGSTFFLSGVPAFAAVQVGDGPLVRGVYRDSSLRSYFASAFRRDLLGRGPAYLFFWDDASRKLVDRTDEPDLWYSMGVGYLLNDRPDVAVEAFELAVAQEPGRPQGRFGLGVARALAGDARGAHAALGALGFGFERSAGAAGTNALHALVAGDTLAARRMGEAAAARAVLDPVPHMVLSRVYAGDPAYSARVVLEAAAAVAVAPGYAGAWRNWSMVQRQFGHDAEALSSLERYFALDPTAEREDPQAAGWREELRARQPGGVEAQRAMKRDLEPVP